MSNVRGLNSPWFWPVISFFGLITLVIVGTILALVLGGS